MKEKVALRLKFSPSLPLFFQVIMPLPTLIIAGKKFAAALCHQQWIKHWQQFAGCLCLCVYDEPERKREEFRENRRSSFGAAN